MSADGGGQKLNDFLDGLGLGAITSQLKDLQLGELLDTPPPGIDEAVAVSKVRTQTNKLWGWKWATFLMLIGLGHWLPAAGAAYGRALTRHDSCLYSCASLRSSQQSVHVLGRSIWLTSGAAKGIVMQAYLDTLAAWHTQATPCSCTPACGLCCTLV